jgi:hypothetical protein
MREALFSIAQAATQVRQNINFTPNSTIRCQANEPVTWPKRRTSRRRVRRCELRMIQRVDSLCRELQRHPLGDASVLDHG